MPGARLYHIQSFCHVALCRILFVYSGLALVYHSGGLVQILWKSSRCNSRVGDSYRILKRGDSRWMSSSCRCLPCIVECLVAVHDGERGHRSHLFGNYDASTV